jgi:hypothetical protein
VPNWLRLCGSAFCVNSTKCQNSYIYQFILDYIYFSKIKKSIKIQKPNRIHKFKQKDEPRECAQNTKLSYIYQLGVLSAFARFIFLLEFMDLA